MIYSNYSGVKASLPILSQSQLTS